MGGLSGGHYTAYVKKDGIDPGENGEESQWFEINDSSTSPVNMSQVSSFQFSSVHILFYFFSLISQVCSRSGYLLFYHSNSCECDHYGELTNILDCKMAKRLDKNLAKESTNEPDISETFEEPSGRRLLLLYYYILLLYL